MIKEIKKEEVPRRKSNLKYWIGGGMLIAFLFVFLIINYSSPVSQTDNTQTVPDQSKPVQQTTSNTNQTYVNNVTDTETYLMQSITGSFSTIILAMIFVIIGTVIVRMFWRALTHFDESDI